LLKRKSKYYYDYTRNMSNDKQYSNCNCTRNLVACACIMSEAIRKELEKKEEEAFFNAWTESLEKMEQPKACNIDNPDCENCGS